MNESLITGLVALAATAVGWVLGRADTWLKQSEDHKRARRYILSYLLDLHHWPPQVLPSSETVRPS